MRVDFVLVIHDHLFVVHHDDVLAESAPHSGERVLARADELAEMGLAIEPFGTGAVAVREVPAILGETNVQGLIRDLADDLAELDGAIALEKRIDDVCATMACHGSVRAGRRLNRDACHANSLLRSHEIANIAGSVRRPGNGAQSDPRAGRLP